MSEPSNIYNYVHGFCFSCGKSCQFITTEQNMKASTQDGSWRINIISLTQACSDCEKIKATNSIVSQYYPKETP